MPEGPELHLASRYVNTSCKDRIFTGKVEKNPVHKCSDVDFDCAAYTIAAASRGKEMQLFLTKLNTSDRKKTSDDRDDDKDDKKFIAPETLKILFRFGMSGNFQFTTTDAVHKHSHLRFFTSDTPPMVLSFVDVRRFGRWEVGADWSKDRGPDPMFEYLSFRSNILSNLKNAAFNQPICEAMLNQKFFNGIGNYLRAEILYRLKIAPFERARELLEGLPDEPPDVKPLKAVKGGSSKKGGADPDIIHLCHTVPLEVIAIGCGGYTADGKASDYSDFMKWLQCYYQDGMRNMVDHNGRTIWFQGPAGPMAPKEGKSRSPMKKRKQKGSGDTTSSVKKEKDDSGTKKNTRQRKRPATETDADDAGPVAKKGAPARKKTLTEKNEAKPNEAKNTRQNRASRIAAESQESKSASKKSSRSASIKASGSASKNENKSASKNSSRVASIKVGGSASKNSSRNASTSASKNGNKRASKKSSRSASMKASESASKNGNKSTIKSSSSASMKVSGNASENANLSGKRSTSKTASESGSKGAGKSAAKTVAPSKVATEGLVNESNGSVGRGRKKSVPVNEKIAQRKENEGRTRASTRSRTGVAKK